MSRPVVTVLAVLLALVPFSGADTVHVILIGEGSLYGQQEPPPRYNFTFFTADSPSPFTVATLNDFTENSGFGQCNPCDPKFLVGDLLLDEGIGHNAFGYYSGNILFTSVSFKSSLLPSGNLLVVYRAMARMGFRLCADPECSSLTGQDYVWTARNSWDIRALFKPNPNGGYDFLHATFFGVVPEPGTLCMFGTGLLGVLGAARKKLLR
jgi:hypothetical protein